MARDLGNTRRAAGLSIREVARRVRVSHDTITRLELGERAAMTLDLIAKYAAVVGLQLAASLHPDGDPVRDRGHLALLDRLRKRLPSVRLRTEVPVPISGDLRSADAIIPAGYGDVVVEAETHLGDIQLIERRSAAKVRDFGAARLVLLVANTRHNRGVLANHPELRERFPIDTRTCLARAWTRGGPRWGLPDPAMTHAAGESRRCVRGEGRAVQSRGD